VLQLEHNNYQEARQVCTEFLDHPLIDITSSITERL